MLAITYSKFKGWIKKQTKPTHLKGLVPINSSTNSIWKKIYAQENLEEASLWLFAHSKEYSYRSDVWDFFYKKEANLTSLSKELENETPVLKSIKLSATNPSFTNIILGALIFLP